MSVVPPPATAHWIEPTSLLPLRWGRYTLRRDLGLALVMAGIATVQVTSTYSLNFGLVGSLAMSAGWIILPAAGWRRILVIFPTLVIAWLLLGRADFSGLFAVFLAAWLLVRHRPARSYASAILPIVSGYLIAQAQTSYSFGWVALTISTVVTVAAAWLARWIATTKRSLPGKTSSRSAEDLD